MKKGQVFEGEVNKLKFPNKGMVVDSRLMEETAEGRFVPAGEAAEGENCTVVVKNTLPGQRVRFAVSKKRHGTAEGRLLEVVERAPMELEIPYCEHYGACGGCSYQTLPYEEQLKLKSGQVLDLLTSVAPDAAGCFEGICPSPQQFGYRNKMEFTFGDEYKDGPLALGLHRRGGMYDIVNVDHCRIVDEDFRKILSATRDYFCERGTPFYHRTRQEGYLRHLLVRKAAQTEEILVDLVTTSQSAGTAEKNEMGPERDLLEGWKNTLLSLPLHGTLAGILHTTNDRPADAVIDEGTKVLYGQDFFYEEILGLTFRITPFSFFQTNSLGAEVLYESARDFIREAFEEAGQDLTGKTVFDLYSGTGTIAQMLAPAAGRVVGVEIVEEAVEAARENAAENGLANCEFIAGDVLQILNELPDRPDFIVLDPPRDGVHPKALKKIVGYGVDRMLYISCKPTSLIRDLKILQESGYHIERLSCVDMFPGTVHVETVALLKKNTTC